MSHEFHVLAESGEDAIAFSDASDYAANIEKAEALAPTEERPAPSKELKAFPTPDAKSIAELKEHYGVKPHRGVKTLIVYGAPDENEQRGLVALVLRGDHDLNQTKAEKHPLIASPITFATPEQVFAKYGVNIGFIGPVGLDIPVSSRSTAY